MPIDNQVYLQLLDFYEGLLEEELKNKKRQEYIKYYSFRIEATKRLIKDVISKALNGRS